MTNLLTGSGIDPGGPVFDAATVVLLRDGGDGLECLMLRKTEAQAFGGLWVFPGGRVEDRDGTELAGARQAAVREVVEETGLVIGVDALVPVAHWTPPTRAPRRYRTWFFVAPLPDGAGEVVVDGGEIGDHVWVRPGDALARHGRQEIELLPPTWMTLRRLADHNDVAHALADAAARPVERFTTEMRLNEDGVPVALWEGDVAYAAGRSTSATSAAEPPDAARATDATGAARVGASGSGTKLDLDAPGGRHRLVMDPAGWRYEHSPAPDAARTDRSDQTP